MKKYVAFVRGINVGAHNRIKMDDLKALFASRGCKHVISILQSGNLVFQAENLAVDSLEMEVEKELFEKHDINNRVYVFTEKQWNKAVLEHPLEDYPDQFPDRCYAMFFKNQLPNEVSADEVEIDEKARLHIGGHMIYLYSPEGYLQTKYQLPYYEKKYKIQGTARNFKTIARIHKKLEDLG